MPSITAKKTKEKIKKFRKREVKLKWQISPNQNRKTQNKVGQMSSKTQHLLGSRKIKIHLPQNLVAPFGLMNLK